MTDSIADALIRIKNGYRAGKLEVPLRYSRIVEEICKVLKQEGFIASYKTVERNIVVDLKYTDRTPALADVKRVSKPGLRVYKGVKLLPYVLNGLGIAIISTPNGIMTDKQARKLKIGGEVMAEVW